MNEIRWRRIATVVTPIILAVTLAWTSFRFPRWWRRPIGYTEHVVWKLREPRFWQTGDESVWIFPGGFNLPKKFQWRGTDTTRPLEILAIMARSPSDPWWAEICKMYNVRQVLCLMRNAGADAIRYGERCRCTSGWRTDAASVQVWRPQWPTTLSAETIGSETLQRISPGEIRMEFVPIAVNSSIRHINFRMGYQPCTEIITIDHPYREPRTCDSPTTWSNQVDLR
jgi:hypothetical protein